MPPEPVDIRADLACRLRCAEGHLRGIAEMIERGADCESIVCQTMAVQGALREVNRRLVKHYLDNRLAADLQAPNPALRQARIGERGRALPACRVSLTAYRHIAD